jgi:APA family basic amino acid/polyamine antiporter
MAVIGGIIGGGIFRTPASVAERVGTAPLFLTAWVLGGLVALAGAFCYGELGSRRPKAGGGYVYLRETLGSLPAFLYGWALLFVIGSGAIAAVAKTFAGYFLALTGLPENLTVPVAVAAIVLLAGINYVGVKPAAITQNIFTILKLTALAALIAVGLALTVPYRLLPSSTVSVGPGGVVIALGAALVPILFTYGGWQQTNFIAEEIIAPERNLPRALVLGVIGVVTVYLLANIVYLRVLGPVGLAQSTAPAADVMRGLLGPVGATIISAGIAASTFGFLNLVILVTPRVFQAMAADGVFFPRFAALHPVYRTPTAAILLQAVWSIVLTLNKSFTALVDYVAFGDWIFFGLTVVGLFIYRSRGGDPPPFRAPGGIWVPGFFVAAAAYVVASSVGANPGNALIGTGLILVGVPVFFYWRGRQGAKPPR